uniref:Uncharacterized protein n=1 Tax=Cucumis melo TaxID=3656 RepID=A0A9I9D5H0_CUCME
MAEDAKLRTELQRDEIRGRTAAQERRFVKCGKRNGTYRIENEKTEDNIGPSY